MKIRPNRPGRGSHIATASFMVDRDRQGEGIGLALGQHVVDWARESAFHAIQFNAVVETSEGAVRLWQRLGVRIVGTVPEAFDAAEHGLVGLHVMYLPLREHLGSVCLFEGTLPQGIAHERPFSYRLTRRRSRRGR